MSFVLVSLVSYLCTILFSSSAEALPPDRNARRFNSTGHLFGSSLTFGLFQERSIPSALWSAAHCSLSAFPLVISDKAGGILETHWIQEPLHPHERFRIKVILLPVERLETSAVEVRAFREVQNKEGKWVACGEGFLLADRIKDAILLKAREIYTNQVQNQRK